MSVVYHEPNSNKPREIPLFEKLSSQRVRRQKGSRNLLFNEEFGNRKKVWNRWTGEQINFTRKALRNMKANSAISNNRNNANNNQNFNNAKTANLNDPEWRIGIGNNGYEPVPKILRPNRTIRQKRRKL
jgi:hypothetical protein